MRGIHRWLVNSTLKGPVTRKMFPFDDVIMLGGFSDADTGVLLLISCVYFCKNHFIIRSFTCILYHYTFKLQFNIGNALLSSQHQMNAWTQGPGKNSKGNAINAWNISFLKYDWQFCWEWSNHGEYIDGLVQERRNFIANALELCLSCTNPSIWENGHLNPLRTDTITIMKPCEYFMGCSVC